MEVISSKSSSSSSEGENQQKKTCANCGTTKTPLWRGGPAGPKSLCNACGIRSRKKIRDALGLSKDKKVKKSINSSSNNVNNKNKVNHHINTNNSSNDCNNKSCDGFKQRLLVLGQEVLMKRPRKQLREEEQAAVLLMALSYGSVYA